MDQDAQNTQDETQNIQPEELNYEQPEMPATQITDEDGVLEQPIEVNTENIELAEEQVAEANPLPASQELAEVADQLKALESDSFENDLQSDESGAGKEAPLAGVDPMTQLGSELTNEDNTSTNTEDALIEGNELEEPNLSLDAQEQTTGDDSSSDQSQQIPVKVNPTDEDFQLQEESVVSGIVGSEDLAKESSGQQLYSTEESLLTEEPVVEDNQTQINDVVAPSAIAVATAMGTSGSNVISATPETASTDQAGQPHGAASSTPQKSSNKVLVVIIISIMLLLSGGAVAYYLLGQRNNVPDASSGVFSNQNLQQVDNEQSSLSIVSADTLDDFKVVCQGGMVRNATNSTANGYPKPLIVFERGSDEQFARNVVNFADSQLMPDDNDIQANELVACIEMKEYAEQRLKTCPITDSSTRVTTNVDFHPATYSTIVYKANTGEQLGEFELQSVSTECPTVAAYDRADPKIFARYELKTLEDQLSTSLADLSEQ